MKPYSEKTNALLDREIRALVKEQYERIMGILVEKKHLIEK